MIYAIKINEYYKDFTDEHEREINSICKIKKVSGTMRYGKIDYLISFIDCNEQIASNVLQYAIDTFKCGQILRFEGAK